MAQALFVILLFTVLTKAISFLKEMIVASRFGTSAEYDLFLEISALPLSVAALLTYTIIYAYTPVFQSNKNNVGNYLATKILINSAMKWLLSSFVFMILTLILLFLFKFKTIGINIYIENQKIFDIGLLVSLIVFAQCLISFLTIPLISNSKNLLLCLAPLGGAVSSVILLYLNPNNDSYTLSFLVLASYFGNLLIMISSLLFLFKTKAFKGGPVSSNTRPMKLKEIAITSTFCIFLIEAGPQISGFFERQVLNSRFFQQGVLSSLVYAQVLLGFFVSIGVLVVVRMLLPKFSGNSNLNSDDMRKFYFLLTLFIFLMFFGALFKSNTIVFLAFYSGNFSLIDVNRVADLLSILSIVIIFDILYSVLASKYYSLQSFKALIFAGAAFFFTRIIVIVLAAYLSDVRVIAMAIVSASAIRLLLLLSLYYQEHGLSHQVKEYLTYAVKIFMILFVYFFLIENSRQNIQVNKVDLLMQELLLLFPLAILAFLYFLYFHLKKRKRDDF